jgi:hypothetical protein
VTRSWLLYGAALIGVPLVWTAFVEGMVVIGLKRGHLPFEDSLWVWWVVFIACLLVGASCLASALGRYKVARVLIPVVYVGVMAIVAFGPQSECKLLQWRLSVARCSPAIEAESESVLAHSRGQDPWINP